MAMKESSSGLDPAELFKSVNKKFEENDKNNAADQQSSHLQSTPCIYKVPEELRELNRSAYNPRVVSIGPIHSNKNDEHLKIMEHVKVTYTKSLFSRMLQSSMASKALLDCSTAMVDLAARAENCYAENVKSIMEKDQLAEMMLIDGCFILELLYRSYLVKIEVDGFKPDDPVFGNPMMLLGVRHDLLLLENQIPFFVLKKLFGLTVISIPDGPSCPSLCECVLSFFGNVMNFRNTITPPKNKKDDYLHILHLLHTCYRPSPRRDDAPPKGKEDRSNCYRPCPRRDDAPPKGKDDPARFWYCASDLKWAGVKFVAGTGEDLFKVNFKEAPCFLRSAQFEIPPVSIYDCSEPFLRNLIAFEQCCPTISRHFTSYAFLMDSLVNSPADVELLENAHIIHNYLGASQEASDLFNNLCKHAVLGEFYFAKSCDDARIYCERRWPTFLASLKRDYFGNPWSGIALLAAFILFVLTVVQTVYTLLSYYGI